MTSEQGQKFHAQAEQAREQGHFLEALKLTDEAILAYQSEGDTAGFAEVLSSRFLTLRHLFNKTGDQNYLILAKHTVIASVEIAQKTDSSATALPLFNLAKIQEELAELNEAISSYQQALKIMKTNPSAQHNRPGVIADMENHLAIAELKNGDQTAKQRALDALTRLSQSDEPQYNQDVWISGGYMRLAQATKKKEYLDQAKVIIDANPDLILRKAQLEKLSPNL